MRQAVENVVREVEAGSISADDGWQKANKARRESRGVIGRGTDRAPPERAGRSSPPRPHRPGRPSVRAHAPGPSRRRAAAPAGARCPAGRRRTSYIAPFFVLFAIFGLYPLFYTLWVSLHDWDADRAGQHAASASTTTGKLLDRRGLLELALQHLRDLPARDRPAARSSRSAWRSAAQPQIRGRTLLPDGRAPPERHLGRRRAIVFAQLFGRDFGLVNWVLGRSSASTRSTGRRDRWSSLDRDRDHGRLALDRLQRADPASPRCRPSRGSCTTRRRWTAPARFRAVPQRDDPAAAPRRMLFMVVIATIGGLQLFTEPLLFNTSPASDERRRRPRVPDRRDVPLRDRVPELRLRLRGGDRLAAVPVDHPGRRRQRAGRPPARGESCDERRQPAAPAPRRPPSADAARSRYVCSR